MFDRGYRVLSHLDELSHNVRRVLGLQGRAVPGHARLLLLVFRVSNTFCDGKNFQYRNKLLRRKYVSFYDFIISVFIFPFKDFVISLSLVCFERIGCFYSSLQREGSLRSGRNVADKFVREKERLYERASFSSLLSVSNASYR